MDLKTIEVWSYHLRYLLDRSTRMPNGCLEWNGSRRNRYGWAVVYCRRYSVHRLSWMLAFGAIPSGMCVCHRCDNRFCLEPSHLFLATHLDNMDDARSKGRLWSNGGGPSVVGGN